MLYFQNDFTVKSAQVRVRFGAGIRRSIADEIDAIGASRAIILTTPQQAAMADEFSDLCGDRVVGRFTDATMHTPVQISEKATALVRELRADVLIAIGGGSTTGLGKAIAYRTDLPQIVVPTTYAGSEATGILGQTENGVKTTLTSPKVQPEVILYDPELITGLPVGMTVTSALNAMAHAAEGLYACDRSPISTLMSIEGLRAFRDGLPKVMASPTDIVGHGETLYGAWLCGTVLGQVGMALHHKLCHTLGGSFDLPHAETHAVVLPHAIAYNAVAVPELLAPLVQMFGHDNPGMGLWHFAKNAGAPMALRDLGLHERDLDRAADLAAANPYWNPRPVTRQGIRDLLHAAWAGTPPITGS